MKENMEHIDIMQSVKPVSVLPGFGAATAAQMEGYFGVSKSVLNRAIRTSTSAGELKDYTFMLTPEDFTKAGYAQRLGATGFRHFEKDGFSVSFTNKKDAAKEVQVYTKSGMIQIAKHLPNSEVAVSIMRNIGWNVPNNTTKKRNNTVKEDIEMEETGIDYTENSNLAVQIFESPEFGDIRIIEENDKVLFCGTDVAKSLAYARPIEAVRSHCPHSVKRRVGVQTGIKADGTPALQNVEMAFIPESDLYRLVFGSKLPSAERFTDWVTEEVLPAIRKHGGYLTPEKVEEALLNPDVLIKLATQLKEERQKNMELTTKNLELSATNKALIGTISEWKRNSVLNALVRSLFPKIKAAPGDKFRAAWNWFYKELNYKYSINLKIRRSRGDSRKCLLDFLKEDEWPKALSVAAAMCERCGINVADVINEVNAQKVS